MCWYCGKPITIPEPIGRSMTCPDCGRDLRCCKQCRFYLPGSRGDCAESQADMVQDKERANFCDWFSLNPRYREGSAPSPQKGPSQAEAFNKLFND